MANEENISKNGGQNDTVRIATVASSQSELTPLGLVFFTVKATLIRFYYTSDGTRVAMLILACHFGKTDIPPPLVLFYEWRAKTSSAPYSGAFFLPKGTLSYYINYSSV